MAHKKTHCVRNHEFSPENTYTVKMVIKDKEYVIQRCRACGLLEQKKRNDAKRKARPCDDCGETGREKEKAWQSDHKILYFCHDEEKSCFNYWRGTNFADRERDSGENAG